MIYNSLLSEFAVLGFEYGYSMATPNVLVLWEAQFGDFYNGAQVMIDQFISSSESKWQRMSGLVMLLPHGYEGQGPEHSSARLERFLQQCAEDNMTVANVTTPANFFHLLRRQLHRPFRKPVVLMSPKSLLRHPLCVSDIDDLYGKTRFQELIDDDRFTAAKAKKLRKVLFCSGKVYYDLLEYQQEKGIDDVAIVRVEQLYPIARQQWKKILGKYKGVPHVWVQEEPENMGAWQFINYRIPIGNWDFVSRKKSASPATGFKKIHDEQQASLMERAFS